MCDSGNKNVRGGLKVRNGQFKGKTSPPSNIQAHKWTKNYIGRTNTVPESRIKKPTLYLFFLKAQSVQIHEVFQELRVVPVAKRVANR